MSPVPNPLELGLIDIFVHIHPVGNPGFPRIGPLPAYTTHCDPPPGQPGLPKEPIINPPSTTIVWPVTYDERADSSHSAVSATSEASPQRPIATFRTTAE